jgi:eukaryotic-like serine/threonine-protein kinase
VSGERPEVLEGRYRLVGALGQGGVAEINDALDLKLGRNVAIKALLPVHRKSQEARERLFREAYLGALLTHPHICGVSDIGELDDGSPFIVMERLTGKTVAERLRKTGPLPILSALAVAGQVLSALAAAHAYGVIHRDVKPANVFMSKVIGLPSVAKLLDFGAARCPSSLLPARKTAEGVVTHLTATGLVVGTPQYMAPEQAEGKTDLDARTDLYQVGTLLYELLSGHRPYEAESYAELLVRIARGGVKPLAQAAPSLAPEVVRLVTRAMARSRTERFQGAEEFLEAVDEVRAAVAPSFGPNFRDDWDYTTRVQREGEPTDMIPVVHADSSTTLPVGPRDRIR